MLAALYASACGHHKVAILLTFQTKRYLWRSDWLKLCIVAGRHEPSTVNTSNNNLNKFHIPTLFVHLNTHPTKSASSNVLLVTTSLPFMVWAALKWGCSPRLAGIFSSVTRSKSFVQVKRITSHSHSGPSIPSMYTYPQVWRRRKWWWPQ